MPEGGLWVNLGPLFLEGRQDQKLRSFKAFYQQCSTGPIVQQTKPAMKHPRFATFLWHCDSVKTKRVSSCILQNLDVSR